MKSASLPLRSLQALALLLALAGLSGCGHSPSLSASDFVAPEGARVVPPKVVQTVAPIYPHEMRRAGQEHVVQVEAVILANGTVHNALAVGGDGTDFAAEAVRAVNQWTFQPGTINEIARPMKVLIPVSFTFDSENSPTLTAKR